MRFFSLMALLFVLAGCAGPRFKATESGEGATQAPPVSAFTGEDPGSVPVVDPAAPSGKDNFPGAVLAGGEPVDRPNTLAPGFLIRLGHPEDRDLNGTFRIGFDGRIDLPYDVSFKTDNLTMDEFRAKVVERYKPYFKIGTRLTVELVEKAYFIELRGLITKPGKYKVHSDSSVDEVISLGGGFPTAPDNQPRFLRITHGDQTKVVNLEDYYKSGRLKTAVVWKGGEVLFFQKEPAYSDVTGPEAGTQVQVLGELKRPGEFAHRPGADVYFYMSEAGGPTRDTDFFKVQIFRGLAGQKTMTEFELEDPKSAPEILPGDILVFQADKPTRFQKGVGTVANLASIITAIALVIIAL
ncbi:MAG TPA: SLBB domain-containing protein [Bdellovibrionota bacterium]|jgi:protein involved in polysaccharide export with SLBB domain